MRYSSDRERVTHHRDECGIQICDVGVSTVGMTKTEEYLIMERRNRVADLYLKGLTQSKIAELEGVTQPCIHNDLKAIRKQWVSETLTNFDEIQARELAKIDNLETQAWKAWERSCEDLVTVTEDVKRELRAEAEETVEEKVSGLAARLSGMEPEKKMMPTEQNTKTTTKGQAGDPRFLERIAWCIEQRVKIFGLVKSDKQSAAAVINFNWNNIVPRSEIEDPVQQHIKQLQSATIVQQVPEPEQQEA